MIQSATARLPWVSLFVRSTIVNMTQSQIITAELSVDISILPCLRLLAGWLTALIAIQLFFIFDKILLFLFFLPLF